MQKKVTTSMREDDDDDEKGIIVLGKRGELEDEHSKTYIFVTKNETDEFKYIIELIKRMLYYYWGNLLIQSTIGQSKGTKFSNWNIVKRSDWWEIE